MAFEGLRKKKPASLKGTGQGVNSSNDDNGNVWLGGCHGWVTEDEANEIKAKAKSDKYSAAFDDLDLDIALAGLDDVSSDVELPATPPEYSSSHGEVFSLKTLSFPSNSEKDTQTTPKLSNAFDPEQSTELIIEEIRRRFSAPFEYSDENRKFNYAAAIELAKRDVSPFRRYYKKHDRVACKDPNISQYMNDIQVFDLHWVWSKHHGHKVNTKAQNGLFFGIFSGDEFDFGKAYEIAVGITSFQGKPKNLTKRKKMEFLWLPEYMQMELSWFLTETIREKQKRVIKKEREVKEKLDSLRVKAMDVKYKLKAYKKSNPRARLDVDVHTNVWIALELCKKNKTHFADALEKYNELTGKSISKSLMQKRKATLRRVLRK